MGDVAVIIIGALVYWAILLLGGQYLLLGIVGMRKALEPNLEAWERVLIVVTGGMWTVCGAVLLVSPALTHGVPGFIGMLIGGFLAWRFDQATTHNNKSS